MHISYDLLGTLLGTLLGACQLAFDNVTGNF